MKNDVEIGLRHQIRVVKTQLSAEQAAKIEECRNDEFKFFESYLPHYFPLPPADFHKEIIHLLKWPPKERLTEIIHGEIIITEPDANVIVMAAPREHAKSTLVSFGIILHRICYGLSNFIVLVSDTADQSRLFLENIRDELETNEQIKEDFGDLVGRKWTETEIVTANNVKVLTRGTGSAIRGIRHGPHRPDLIICDDLENDKHVDSPTQRDKNERWFNSALMNAPGPGATVFVIGTILHYDSLLSRLLKRTDAFATRTWRAVTDGKPLWPPMWPLERLAARRKIIGSAAFEQEFQNNPLDLKTKPFKRETFGYYRTEDLPPKLAVYGAFDPAIGQSLQSDRSALVTVGVDDERGRIYVLSAIADRLGVTEQVESILVGYRRWEHLELGIEAVAYQRALKQLVDDASQKENLFIPTREITHDTNKERRIQTLAPLIEQGVILFREDQTELIEELDHFPKADHDDLPDALEMAVNLARFGGGVIEFKSSGRKRVGLSTAMSRF